MGQRDCRNANPKLCCEILCWLDIVPKDLQRQFSGRLSRKRMKSICGQFGSPAYNTESKHLMKLLQLMVHSIAQFPTKQDF